MHNHKCLTQVLCSYVVAPGVLLMTLGVCTLRADDPGFFGRLFRLGNPPPSNSAASSPNQSTSLPYSRNSESSSGVAPLGPAGSSGSSNYSNGGGFNAPPVTPPIPSNGPTPRLTPKPRVSAPVTTADPVLTRFALGRSNDGSQFGMSLQIFSDGTVIDSEGVHRMRGSDLRPIFEAVQSGEIYRLRGHCGAPSTDFTEYVHIIVYERRMGRLMAHSFSYSGNPQGCDHVVKHLHAALEGLQVKLSRQPMTNNPAASAAPVSLGASPMMAQPPAGISRSLSLMPTPNSIPSRQPSPPAANPAVAVPNASVIPLTPLDQPH
jgi:hypothetical protein